MSEPTATSPTREQLEELLRHQPAFSSIIDREGRILWTSHPESTLRLEDAVGQPLDAFVAEAHGDIVRSTVARAFRTGAVQFYEVQGYGEEQLDRWYAVEVIPFDTGRAYVVAHDISDRMAVEADLRRGAERLRTISEHLPQTMVVIDGSRRILFSNRYRELIGTTVDDLLPEGERSRVLPRYEALFAHGEAFDYEIRSAGRLWRVDALPFPADEGQARALVVGRDVTTEREALRRVEDSETKLGMALAAGRIGLWEWDVAAGRMTANAVMANRLGMPAERIPTDRDWWEMRIHPEDREAWRRAFEGHAEGGVDSFEAEVRVRGEEGEVVGWLQERGCIVERDDEGNPLRVIGTHQDVTARHTELDRRLELEAQLHQAQKLDSIGRLAGGIAHDFNNLLLVIQTQLEFALEAVREGGDVVAELEDIGHATSRAQGLTGQLLSFSRQEPRRREAVLVSHVVRRAARMLTRALPASIELDVVVCGDGTIKADRGQLEQVLLNLCINARDAIDQQGRVTIQVDRAALPPDDPRGEARGRVAGRYVTIAVRDTGAGIDEDTKAWIFEPFFTTKRRGEGTGLGLSVVQGIAEQHEGFIDVESIPGEGSTFTLWFPEHSAPAETKTETVLVAEDDAIVRRVITKTLRRAGYRVLEAVDGQQALEVFEAHRAEVDAVVLDAVMPRLGGRGACEQLLALDAGLPIMFCTGYAAGTLPAEFLEEHGLPVVHKPFSRDDLLTPLRALLERSREPGEE